MSSKQAKFKDNSMAEAAAQIYADPGKPPVLVSVPDSGRRIAKPTEILKIWPDPTQPRRAAPSAARAAWDGSPASVIDQLIPAWQALAEKQLGAALDLKAVIEGKVELARPKKGPLASFLDLVSLAITLHTVQDDSVAPANIVKLEGDQYILEYGERRWLAHHLLLKYFPDQGWDKMPAVEVKKYDVWRQAAENGARANLNAIGKARQLAKLLMDMHGGEENFLQVEDFPELGGSDRAYYAQVEDAEKYRIPYGKTEQVLAVMGLKDDAQIRRHRALLRINDDLWVMADDDNLTESEIRALAKTGKSVSGDTNLKPVTLKVPTDRWQEVKAVMPDAKDDEIMDRLIAFYLEHQETE